MGSWRGGWGFTWGSLLGRVGVHMGSWRGGVEVHMGSWRGGWGFTWGSLLGRVGVHMGSLLGGWAGGGSHGVPAGAGGRVEVHMGSLLGRVGVHMGSWRGGLGFLSHGVSLSLP